MPRIQHAFMLLTLLFFACSFAPTAQAQLIINPIYDVSITSDPNGTTIISSITSVIQEYEQTFSNPATVNITFKEMTNGLGNSLTYGYGLDYSDFADALRADKQGQADSNLLNFLPADSDAAYMNDTVSVSTANLRALGIDLNPPTGQPDSTISLNTSLLNLSRDPATYNANKYDLMAVASHEIDEALGFRSALNNLANGATPPENSIAPLDLYRYSSSGVRSFTTDVNADAYFSVDNGQTSLEQFNQNAAGDFSDYASSVTPHVQDAFGTPGSQPNLSVAEITGLEAIGYNLTVAPEPSSWEGLGVGICGVFALCLCAKKRALNPV